MRCILSLVTFGTALLLASSAQADVGSRPAPKRCLPPPTEVDADLGIAVGIGLPYEDASASMHAALPGVLPCIAAAGASPTRPLVLEIQVACSGVVERIAVADAGDWPTEVQACVVVALSTAEFPAHDLPDGDTFAFPVTYRAPAPMPAH